MRWTSRLASSCALVILGAGVFAPPARADGEDTTTGILAGVGISAASGKTTLGAGAGTIEAGLLDQSAFQKAGAMVAATVSSLNPPVHEKTTLALQGASAAADERPLEKRPVLILAHDEKIDLVMPVVIRTRLEGLTGLIDKMCAVPPPAAVQGTAGAQPGTLGALSFMKKLLAPGVGVQLSDAVTAVTTETAIGGVTLAAEDRLLINAIIMNVATPSTTGRSVTRMSPDFKIPSEPVGYDAGSKTLRAYTDFQGALLEKRGDCGKTDMGKAFLGVVDGYVTSLNTVGASGIAPLTAAIQFDTVVQDKSPLLLRVAIERIGGTSIVRSGLIYTFGWPNAATVSAGLRVSYRLIDPSNATLAAVGEVRCAVRQTNVKRVVDVIEHKPYRRSVTQSYPLGEAVCDESVAIGG